MVFVYHDIFTESNEVRMKALINGTWQSVSAKTYYNGVWKYCTPTVLNKRMDKMFFLDCGRKYYTIAWVKNLIDTISSKGYTALFLHFSEDMGLRIESKLYPWLAGSDDSLCIVQGITDVDEGKYWSQREVGEIVTYASSKSVEIIPSFDSPAHMNYIVKKYNEHENSDIGNYYHYNNQVALVQGSGNTSYSRGIDISNQEAIAFTQSLIFEYADLFLRLGCKRFDIGGDELLGWGPSITSSVPRWQQLNHWKAKAIADTGNANAVAYDCFLSWLNNLYYKLIKLGYKEVFAWNDQVLRSYDTAWQGVVQLNPKISILYWTNTANNSTNTPLTYMQHGYSIYNFVETYNYYVLKSGLTPPTISTVSNWTVEQFGNYTADTSEGKVKGSSFCIWCDNPSYKTETEVLNEVTPILNVRLQGGN